MSVVFGYRAVADRLRIPPEQLRELEALVRKQYAGDEMMAELRLLRTLRAIEEGATTLTEAIAEFGAEPAQPGTRLG